ncbi:transporter substrate-binding domain-containing protein [Lacimicrobium sp. SS2-24]|uniref:substrate-binding periplasmic protein n=1 Tax=Lacimicrobium sp. SS2-24 TaxID=2005569 RepID=UPI0011319854|nr:transporter substrate-binding domain-containing protein [Lacimicrobium sp. SS2-24]
MRLLWPVLLLLSCSISAAPCTIRASVSGALSPYYFYDEAQQVSGFSVDMLNMLFEPTGCKLTFIELPWGRSLELLLDGDIDIMTNLTATQDREPYLYFIGPHNEERMVVIVDTQKVSDVHDFVQLTQSGVFVAALANGYYGPEFEQAKNNDADFNQNLVLLRTSETQRKMLSSGRVSAVIEDEQVYRHWVDEYQLDADRFVIAFTLYSSPVYLGLSRESLSPRQIDILRAQWQRMLENGALKALAERYQVSLPLPAIAID